MPEVIQRCSVENQKELQFSTKLSPLLERVFSHRGLTTDDDINLSLSGLLKPGKLRGLSTAVELLYQCLQENKRILIVGDFDADGATSCAVAIRALKAFGHNEVQFLVPNRFDYGYGLTPEIVDLARHQNPDLIITVDNGISSIDGVAAANEYGIKVLVTDHHLPGDSLPAAEAIVNPNQPDCQFPSKALAGVGVTFYLMAALKTHLVAQGWFVDKKLEPPNMADFLDLVALGTVADVVPLDRNNRILVEQGLRRIRIGKCCVGIRALLECANRSAADISASDCGFALGPRLNAAGRLDDISIGIACLLTDDMSMAREIATELDGLNKDRRQIEHSMQVEAEKHIATIVSCLSVKENSDSTSDNDFPTGLSLFDEGWHQGVVGILASRIKERYNRPVICFAPATDDDHAALLKGSARSIQGFHIRDGLDLIASRYPGLVDKFGGHAMAAGLSLKRENFEAFTLAFDAVVKEQVSDQDLKAIVLTDGELKPSEMTLGNAVMLKTVLPWGQLLPEPLFDGIFKVLGKKVVGQKHLKLLLSSNDGCSDSFDAIAFNVDVDFWMADTSPAIRLAYSLDVNRFRGQTNLQFIIRHLEKVKQ